MNTKVKKIVSLCAAGIAVGSMMLSGCGDRVPEDKGEPVVTEFQQESPAEISVFAMDTYMKVTAYGAQREDAVNAAVDEILRLDQLLSAGDETGEVGMLNRTGSGICSEDTAYLLERSLELHEQTEGAFNVMMYPLMEIWGFIGGNYAVPSQDTIDGLLPLADLAKVTYDPRSKEVRFAEQGMKIDFGGIAKGYTSARIMDIFDACGITSGIVNLGGNVQVKGKKPDGTNWRVGIQDPNQAGAYLGILQLSDQAAITSGGYERFFEENGIRYHHILDPNTGRPAQSGLTSVTVVSADGTLADGLSTSLFVMGLEKAEAFWKANGDMFDAVMVTDDGSIYVTEGLEGRFESKAGDVHMIRRDPA